MENLERTEAISAANPNKHPRVSLEQVLGYIDKVYYVTGDKLVPSTHKELYPNSAPTAHELDQLRIMTVCTMILKNGWIVIGKTAPASPANFNAEIGRKLAYEECVRQIWPLMGFNLKTQLADEEQGRAAGHLVENKE
jgi:hypothetical protein